MCENRLKRLLSLFAKKTDEYVTSMSLLCHF